MTLFTIGIIIFIIFLLSFLQNPSRLINGFILLSAIMFMLIDLILSLESINQSLAIGVFLIMFILGILSFFGVIIFLILNGITMMKRESRSLSNMLSFIVGVGTLIIIIFVIVSPVLPFDFGIQGIIYGFIFWLFLATILFFLLLLDFLVSALVYRVRFCKMNKDFIIVLGAGLIRGREVSKLLGSRLDKAYDFYLKQKNKKRKDSKIIVSGGKGSDEEISEAEAMKGYLVSKGCPSEDIILEDKAKTTYENMIFAKRIMDKIMKKYKSVFVTNEYHVFRAGILAKKAGLKNVGLGSNTAFYFVPSAFIREFIGVLSLRRWWYVFLMVILALFIVAVFVALHFIAELGYII